MTTSERPRTSPATVRTETPATAIPIQTTEQTTVAAPEPADTTEYILITDPANATLYSSSEQQTTPAPITEYQTTPDALIEKEETATPSTAAVFSFIFVLIGTLVAAVSYIFFKKRASAPGGSEEKTAQELTNVKDIEDECLYTQDGKVFVYLKIDGISIDLYTNEQLLAISKELSAQLVRIKFRWKFLSATRPMDLKPILNLYSSLQSSADDTRRRLLELEEKELVEIANSGGATERQHYAVVWGSATKADVVKKNAQELAEILSENGIDVRPLEEKEIVELLNLINNPEYTRLENRYDFSGELLQALLKD